MKNKVKLHLSHLTVLVFFLASIVNINAEGWEKIYLSGPDANFSAINKVTTSLDGGYVSAGAAYPLNGTGHQDMEVTKVDGDGILQWRKYYGGSGDEMALDIKPTADGGYVLAGYQLVNGSGDHYDVYVVKIDVAGNLMWEQSYSKNTTDIANTIVPTLDGGYLVAGYTEFSASNLKQEYYILKLSSDGTLEWEQTFGGVLHDRAYDIVVNADGSFIVAGSTTTTSVGYDGLVVSLDATGNVLWSQTYGGVQDDEFFASTATIDGGFLFVGRTQSIALDAVDVWLVKTDGNGVEEWTKNIPIVGMEFTRNVQATLDGGYVLACTTYPDPGTQAASQGVALKIDASGNVLWERRFGETPTDVLFNGVTLTQDGGYVFAGRIRVFQSNPNWGGYMVKLNSDGNFYPSYLSGNAVHDANSTCTIDSGELNLQNWMVEAKGNKIFYGITDSLGNYFINVDTGNYNLTLLPPNNLWLPCQPLHLVKVTKGDTLVTDFPVQSLEECIYLTTDISVPFLRRCFDATYTVSYCNQGTIPAVGTYLEIDFDFYLTVNSSTLPWSTQTGNTYTFLTGDLNVNECETFSVDVTLDCNTTALGQTHCTEAHIYPDTICVPALPVWDGSITTVDASCGIDSVTFNISNTGSNNMITPLDYFVVEDNLIMKTGQFQLQVGQQHPIKFPANGSTYRLYANQAPGYFPSNYIPTVALEGCGVDPETQIFSTGFVTQMPEDDMLHYLSIDCQENIGSFDPNDKQAEPSGVGEEHYINIGDDLEYHIRFQNTGTDTAFTVVIRDTISEFLNIGTLVRGASSHQYNLNIINGNILKFTFNNILLVDSTTNEPASHGFIKFRISQQENLPLETVIHNSAAIYFDFNAPVITNETYHRIGEDFVEILSSNIEMPEHLKVNIKIQPNPFAEYAEIVIEGAPYGNKSFEIYDATGRVIRRAFFNDQNIYRLEKGNLTPGIFFYSIKHEQTLLGSGKLVIQ